MSSMMPKLMTAKSPEELYGWRVVPSVKPTFVRRDAARSFAATWDFVDHQGFEKWIPFDKADVNAQSTVLASITEVGVFDGQVLPFQGAASLEVHNIVPHNGGTVIVRGFIGWDTPINVRLNFLII